jgi:hypothetical protein
MISYDENSVQGAANLNESFESDKASSTGSIG